MPHIAVPIGSDPHLPIDVISGVGKMSVDQMLNPIFA
jgi:hypothetical protein